MNRELEIVELLPLIEWAAKRYKENVQNQFVEVEDLIQEGAKAAYDALKRYDASKGAKPWTFVYPRVWGAFVDWTRYIERKRTGRVRSGENKNTVYSLHTKAFETDGGKKCCYADIIESREDTHHLKDFEESVDAIPSLSAREKILLIEYYGKGLRLREVAEMIGVHESRASQMMNQLLNRLRENRVKVEEALT